VREVLEKAGATEVRLARDEAERVKFWAGRKNAFPASGRISDPTAETTRSATPYSAACAGPASSTGGNRPAKPEAKAKNG
jgi:FAD/FMN-containing dehydrogenase